MIGRDEAVRKVAALLRLAARPGTAGEAAAAAAMAQKMMDKYEITSAAALEGPEVAEDESAETFADRPEGWLDTRNRNMPLWKVVLARVIASANGAFTFTAYRGEGRTIEIVGRPSSVDLVRYMYGWLSRELDRLSKEHGRGMGEVWRREFLEGAANEIGVRLAAVRAEAAAEVRAEHATNPGALMRIERGLVKVAAQAMVARDLGYKKHALKSTTVRPRRVDQTARAAGAAAARRINLGRSNKQIGGGD